MATTPAALKKSLEIAVAAVSQGNQNKPFSRESKITFGSVSWSCEVYAFSPENPVHGQSQRHLVVRLGLKPVAKEEPLGYMALNLTFQSGVSGASVPVKADHQTYNLSAKAFAAVAKLMPPVTDTLQSLYSQYILSTKD